ncbi:MAG: TonB-dependent receptor [Gemmatimonadaceae bacterium]|nr:TonB-dependent receptor [Gemmatimonadaceae bacterium]
MPPRVTPRCIVRLAILAIGAPVVAPAAQHPATARDTTRLASVVITADRIARPLAATTSAVTVLDGAALRAAGVTHLADALRTVPGLALARSGSNGAQTSLFLRGGESDYVRLLVDGVPMNDPGGALDLGALTLDNVERIEVVRGPTSVLYGSDAVTGVIQLFTRQAQQRLESSLAVRTGTYGTRVAEATVGARGATGGATLGYAHHASQGMLAFNNAYRNDVLTARGDAIVGGMRSQLTLRHGDNSFEYPTDGAGQVVDRNAMRGERRFSAFAELSRALGDWAEAAVALNALELHGRTSDLPDDRGDTLGFYSYQSLGAVRRRGAEARLHVRPAAGQNVVLALEYGAERQRSADSSNYDMALNRFAASRITRSAMLQWIGEIGRTSVSVGGRYDDNDTYGAFRTGRASVATRLWRGARLRAALGTSFKAPTFLETFSSAFSVGNDALRPERARAWEGGLDQSFAGERWRLALTFFDQRFRDLIQYTWISPTAPNYFNVAAASSRGIEAEVRGEAAPGMTVWGNATALRTRVDDAGFQTGAGATFVQGGRLLRRPPLTIAAGTQLQRISRTRLDLSITRVAARDDRDFAAFPAAPVELDAYTRVDVGGEYKLAAGDGFWRTSALTVRVDNALGARYEEIANFRAPGRVLVVGVRLGTMR